MKNQRVLQVLAILFIFGGIVRLLAGEFLFSLVGIQALWSDRPYFIYIYKVLGAFVVMTGFLLFSVSKNIILYRSLLRTLAGGFSFIGLTMLVSGFYVSLPLVYYIMDFLFCFLIAGLFFKMTI